jgi:hypothetical protein
MTMHDLKIRLCLLLPHAFLLRETFVLGLGLNIRGTSLSHI